MIVYNSLSDTPSPSTSHKSRVVNGRNGANH
jgi:hypothetical protein